MDGVVVDGAAVDGVVVAVGDTRTTTAGEDAGVAVGDLVSAGAPALVGDWAGVPFGIGRRIGMCRGGTTIRRLPTFTRILTKRV